MLIETDPAVTAAGYGCALITSVLTEIGPIHIEAPPRHELVVRSGDAAGRAVARRSVGRRVSLISYLHAVSGEAP
jgi:hypothetical protein